MFWPLALILVALAVFTALVTRPWRPPTARSSVDREQLSGFMYVGSSALLVVAAVVVVLGLIDDGDGRAETVAVLGLLVYLIYLTAAGIVLKQNRPPRS